MRSPPRPRFGVARAALLAAALWLLSPRDGRAETTITYKYQDYREEAGRVAVQAQYGLVEHALSPDAKLKLTGVIDTIAGATPTGQAPTVALGPVPLARMDEVRKAWSLDYSHQLGRTAVTAGAAASRESDYVSRAGSLNTATDFNQKNTQLLLGLGVADDSLRVFHQPAWEEKRAWDAVIGVNQVVDRHTTVSLNLTLSRISGYQSDPYKIISKRTEILPGLFLPLTFPENRPRRRDRQIVLASVNHAVPRLAGAAEASYRFYRDTFGTRSHTLTAAWLQKIGDRLVLTPSARFYQQGAADFYRVTLSGTSIVPTTAPRPDGPHYSADYRLSAFRSLNLGLKLVWHATDRLRLDAAYDHYRMTGRDTVTSPSAYARATILTGGASFTW